MSKEVEFIKSLKLQNVTYTEKSVTTEKGKHKILYSRGNRVYVNLLRSDEEGNYTPRYINLRKISFPTKIDIKKVLGKQAKLLFYGEIEHIFKINSNNIDSIYISDDVNDYEIIGSTLKIASSFYIQMISDLSSIIRKSNNYRSSCSRYLLNKYCMDKLNQKITNRTSISKGEFKLLIDRFHLESKKTAKDYHNYLDDTDISSLQLLFREMILNSLFSPEYIHFLNNYFIKEKLEEIINLGEDILDLGTDNLKTDKALSVIRRITQRAGKTQIRQLENVWQQYFQQYLLYLIFSYQSIYPKIELIVEDENKFPDFIGINHYGGVDIIEIKTHIKNALTFDNNHKNFAFSSELSKAIIQTTNYIDALIKGEFGPKTNPAVKSKIKSCNMYRPRGIIIISSEKYLVPRRNQLTKQQEEMLTRDFTKLRNSLHNIQIITFDEILNTAKKYLNNIVNHE